MRGRVELMKEGEEEDKAAWTFFIKHARVRQIVNFVMIVCPFNSEDISKE